MERRIALLRGINIGPHNRVSMPDLRRLLLQDGFDGVATYLQSGNIVVSSDAEPDALAEQVERLIEKRLGLELAVVVRTRDELAEVIARDPLGERVTEPKRYQVSFLSAEPDPAVVEQLEGLVAETERFAAIGREFYAWHPDGVARSKLWAKLGGKGLGVKITSRNWTTVVNLLALADGS